MSILLPRSQDWLVANWVSRAFFDDCLASRRLCRDLHAKIELCERSGLTTLDLREALPAELEELLTVAQTVISADQDEARGGFATAADQRIYLHLVNELRELLQRLNHQS